MGEVHGKYSNGIFLQVPYDNVIVKQTKEVPLVSAQIKDFGQAVCPQLYVT